MNKTTQIKDIDWTNQITVNTDTLAELLDCGKVTARKIGSDANARIRIGRRTLWNIDKIRSYLSQSCIE